VTAVTREVLLVAARAVDGGMPELSQVGGGKGVGVAGSTERVGEDPTATGAVSGSRLAATVARPHQPVLFVKDVSTVAQLKIKGQAGQFDVI
jgi:fructose-1-phosphate kinase PfkB-like protein